MHFNVGQSLVETVYSVWFYQGCQVDQGDLVVLDQYTHNRVPPSVLNRE